MNSVGQTLKGRRERLGMTLNELESRTQMKRHTLKLIETNEFEALNNENYAEGFIKKYAKAVNIDSEQLIEAHRDEIPNNDEQMQRTIEAFSQEKKPTYRSKNNEPMQLAIIISFVVIITAILWILAVLML
ncbi:helix-turn-helix domain-containing protein [Staphylococcus succinus]|uniref:helix-turn-helix domain-containing protein n=1 Tax=Staphylococcus succinus TaxID=61015 RepID=UPI000E6A2DC2|nr:helix-turn-helix domain-containing protein [Staphylococcus succinus]RIN29071.1 helix-turn-helix domain-containing protein [Staphylococcus succinus]